MAKIFKWTLKLVIYGFSIIGFILVGGYFAVYYGFTNTKGQRDINNSKYQNFSSQTVQMVNADQYEKAYEQEIEEKKILCQMEIISNYSVGNAEQLLAVLQNTKDILLVKKMIFALEIRLGQNEQYGNQIKGCAKAEIYNKYSENYLMIRLKDLPRAENIYPWVKSEEWGVVQTAILKDKEAIFEASNKARIDPRIVLAVCLVEQFRLYNTQREYYEQFFKPLKILGNANKMAWGVMSIKEKTAIKIEENLKNSSSNFYIGTEYENLLSFSSTDPNQERFQRLTDDHNHFFSYLYASLYLKQIMAQWQKAGYNISARPEILGTLYNLGFDKSSPKENPVVGGSTLQIGEIKYTFGSLAYEIYYSGELVEQFPLTNHNNMNL